MTAGGCGPQESAQLLARVDHLVYAAPDLEAAADSLEDLLGVRASAGGQHTGRGTRNALIALGPSCYLEILGPDPEQPKPDRPRWFGVDDLESPRLVRWAAKAKDLERLAGRAGREGLSLGPVISGSRKRSDGVVLSWRFTDPATMVADGIVPFLIDWGKSPHPAVAAAGGALLISLRAEHPDPERVGKLLASVGIELSLRSGPAPALLATIRGRRGTVELT